MNRLKLTLIFLLSGLSLMPIFSYAITDKDNEIGYLLKFISNSGCEFIRNGASHSSIKATEHIEKKYDYVRSRVNSAEDFIKYTATKSSISGRPYQVKCDGKEQSSAQWLIAELKAYRNH